ncbi:FAD-dependent oxidoreductase [Halorubellus sp. JP-L1]|uniref:FAD-dependent tricarballylate dehydrogenase TcuA n=1 Tax=Halorubellus sp. JP-L1 TaxID=2715753 RepID=UPI001409E3D2|nr:FAD-dependent tricarballylate dehydrogenase TcuA [Halorubellus sp. JP-L1]NHN42816.1 FAD-dependent oxidoreductase [Halorubellus sp. JP-L1]
METRRSDLVVIGCGIAGLSAGLRGAELGMDVTILEKAPKAERGGQTRYSESFRAPSASTDLSEWGYEFAVPDYTEQDFYDDIMARTDGSADPELARTVVENAGPTIEWLTSHGVEWDMEPLAVGYVAGRTWFDSPELIEHLVTTIEDLGGEIHYEAEARDLDLADDHSVEAVTAVVDDRFVRFECEAAVLATGGYESSEEKRAKYIGAGFEEMKVRGSPFNTGEGIDMAVDAGANAVGQWSGAHMAIIDAASPAFGGGANRVDGYQYGLILNKNGERFVDEGEDARAHTYAKFGRLIFEEPEHVAYIVVDSKVHDLVRATGPSDPVIADTVPDLLAELDIDESTAEQTVSAFNDACDPGEFDPEVLDGNDAQLDPPKSNWALPVDEPPFYAYAVTGGITFGFGGVEITSSGEVKDSRGHVISGLYGAGNSTGGLFYNNYPGGTGLTNAAVFGKLAAEHAHESSE